MQEEINDLFPHRITAEPLFCRRCQMLRPHGIYAREAYSMHGGILPKIPLLCVCDICRVSYFAFSQEFSFVQNNSSEQNYTKIPGKNRLFAGNWIYIRGSARPGKIKRLINFAGKKSVTVDFGNGDERDIEILESDPTHKELSPKGFRLLPAQCGETLIGDSVYHVKRDAFGRACGLVHDGDTDKLAVQLENGIILFITLPDSYQSLPNARLFEMGKLKLQSLADSIREHIALEARHGILFVSGVVRSLAERRIVQIALDNVPSVRGTVNCLKVLPHLPVPDTELANSIYKIFEDSKPKDIAYYDISVNLGHATVRIGYYNEEAVHDFENRLEHLQGVLKLSMLPECVQEPTPEEKERATESEAAIANLLFKNEKKRKVRVAFVGKRIFLSGSVYSIMQKRLALFQFTKFPWQIPFIENYLRILSSEA